MLPTSRAGSSGSIIVQEILGAAPSRVPVQIPAARRSRHQKLLNCARVKTRGRPEELAVRAQHGRGPEAALRVTSNLVAAADLHKILALLPDEDIAIHPEGDALVIAGNLKTIHACLDRIEGAVALLKSLGLGTHESIDLLRNSPPLWDAFADGSAIAFQVKPGGQAKLSGKQDIPRLQALFRALAGCAHGQQALGLLEAAPSQVVLKSLLSGDAPLAHFAPPHDLQRWTVTTARAAKAAARKQDYVSLSKCFDIVPDAQKANFAQMMLPNDPEKLRHLLSAIVESAVAHANSAPAIAESLLEFATELAVHGSGFMSRDQRDNIQATIVEKLSTDLGSKKDVAHARLLLLGLHQAMHDPQEGLSLTLGELRTQIEQRRLLVGISKAESSAVVREQLGELELAYAQSMATDLEQRFDCKLGLPLHLKGALARDAIDALLSLVEFEVASPDAGMVDYGRAVLKGLADRLVSDGGNGLSPELSDRLAKLLAKDKTLAVALHANSGNRRDAVQALPLAAEGSRIAAEAFAIFLASPLPDDKAREAWGALAEEHLKRILSEPQFAQPEALGLLIASDPHVRTALDVLGRCDRKRLEAFLGERIPETHRIVVTAMLFGAIPQPQGNVLFNVCMGQLSAGGLTAAMATWSQADYSAFVDAALRQPMGVKHLGRMLQSIQDDARSGKFPQEELKKIFDGVRSAFITFIVDSKAQGPDTQQAAEHHSRLVKEAYRFVVKNPVMRGPDAALASLIAKATPARLCELFSVSTADLQEALKKAVVAERINRAITTDVDSALVALADVPPAMLHAVSDSLAYEDLATAFSDNVTAAFQSGDLKTVDRLFANLGKLGMRFNSRTFPAALLNATVTKMAPLGPAACCRVVLGLVRSGIGDSPTIFCALLLMRGLETSNMAEVEYRLAEIAQASWADSPAKKRLADTLYAALSLARARYDNGDAHLAPLIAGMVPILRDLKPLLSQEQKPLYRANRDLVGGASWSSLMFKWNLKNNG